MKTLYLVRHGEIEQNTPRRFVGSTDLPLTARGRSQMLQVAGFLASQTVDGLVYSPLARCRQAAEIIGGILGIGGVVSEALKEIHLGSWEGLTAGQVKNKFPGQYEARGEDLVHFRPGNGESFQDLLVRVWPAFEALRQKGDKKIAVIAHSGVNRVILCKLLGMPLENLFRFDQAYGCCNVIEYKKGEYCLKALNYLPA